MIVFSKQGPSIASEQITSLEKALGARLSDAYANFLMINNGGMPEPDVIDVVGMHGSPTDVQVFFGIGRDIQSSDLFWNLSVITERCPNQRMLPIACDSGGNPFCLKVKRGIASEVAYCDLDDPNCKIYYVAKNFDEFLAKLRRFEQ